MKAELPHLEAAMPADINVTVAIDRSTTIRASLHDTELTLVIAVILVTLVVFLFLRNLSATLIPERCGADFNLRHFRRDVSAGLQPRHPVADGADHRDRLRRRRRDRRAGKHLPPYRRRHAAHAGGVPRRARGRLHGAVDQPVADRRIHSDPADGRHSRPAVPRIHRDAVDRHPGLAGDFADHHADDVRAVPADAAARSRRSAAAGFRAGPARLRAHADLGAAPSADWCC